ncbi:trypsin-like serine protease [Streptomyces finlayi]|uniref:Trypsin-like serine protease n=1 Tax=Streptomyces finlayi TaxID=67296 RepID=A0A7G7BHU1_9ACTN|nr:trypsin-like serine protease [Streptomyces finlayi]QNE74906.1 trypsin-like serine protease [Streptomyces finlayi]
MHIRTRGGRHSRRLKLAVPAVAVTVLALVGTGLTMSSSQAEEPVLTVAAGAVDRPVAPSDTELRERVVKAAEADRKALAPSKLNATDDPGPAPMVIGGTETSLTTAPWMAQLWYDDGTGGFFCGGVVIAPTKIATAAHCVKGFDWAANGTVVTGAVSTETTGTGEASWPYRQWNHPLYNDNDGAADNDIAVLTLSDPVAAKPLPVMAKTDTALYAAGTQAKVYGWGRTSSTDNGISTTLRSATLPIVSDSACTSSYGSWFKAGHMVCAGKTGATDSATTGACNGDSGGPLVVGGKLVGIVSWGIENCVGAGMYSVFAKVSSYVPAINARAYDTNLNYDHRADLLARKASTNTMYGFLSNGSSMSKYTFGSNWGGLNLVLQTDLNRDDYQDLIYRTSDGSLYWDWINPATQEWESKRIATGWSSRKQILSPGDLTGDGHPDVLSTDSAGDFWLYPGKGNGSFAARSRIGGGGLNYSMVRGSGDFTNDGKADIIARGAGGKMYLFPGTGKASAPFASKKLVRTWDVANALVTTGDFSGDGIADIIVRVKTGELYLYPGTGRSDSGIFGSRKLLGSGAASYNLFG